MPHNYVIGILRVSRVFKRDFGIDTRAIMKNLGNIALFTFFIMCMFLLKPRQDVVFEAVDVSQYIKLFEKDRDFVLCLDENKLYTGTYFIRSDTVILSYAEQLQSAMIPGNPGHNVQRSSLPRKLYIDESASRIISNDGQLFSAEISRDLREKPLESTAYDPVERNNGRAQILAFWGVKE